MSDEELGFYHRCLNFAWINNGIPADPGARARALRRNRHQADARWTTRVASRFLPHGQRPGYLVNARQETERLHAEQISVKASESAKARYGRSAETTAVALHAHAGAESASVSESGFELKLTTETKTVSRGEALALLQVEWFEREFWPDFWLHKGKKAALAAFKAQATSEEKKNLIVSAMRQQRPEMLTREAQHRKWAQGWLNGERFHDELEAPVLRPKTKNDRAVEILFGNLTKDRKIG